LRQLRIVNRTNAVLATVSGLLVLAVVSLTVLEVVLRRIFDSPTTWTFDYARYFVLYSFMFAGAYTLQNDGHIQISFIAEKFSSRIRLWLAVLSQGGGLVFSMVLTWLAVKQTVKSAQRGWHTQDVTSIPEWNLYIGIALGALMLSLTFLVRIINLIHDGAADDTPTAPVQE
jgi:C4-dicarboxylate transporter, DctQ subunit